MSATQHAPLIFSNLPVELLREVFEHAASSDRATARSLSLVSSRVRHWIDPALFHTVVLSSTRTLRAFLTALTKRPADFAAQRVKHLGVFALGPVQSIDQVLAACKGVQSLACGFSLPSYKLVKGCATVQALDAPREQHLLGVAGSDGWDAALVGPSVTHLRMHLSSILNGGSERSGWDRLAQLPQLTHLAVVYRATADKSASALFSDLEHLLSPQRTSGTASKPSNLQLILVQVLGTNSGAFPADKVIADVNSAAVAAGGNALRIAAERAPLSAARQWEDSVRSGRGVWETGEEVVRARLAAVKQ
ncbi:hypothetical protein OBBRIDRAFT_727097 [Obba rivulosa]|uniref:F-box domain-containing protein n=1 Tax=Obba rivulosa TaxID=1052685 RepID=A0A8E2AWF0_9APHY|nr:hypothetical protein OBBRIDRAFT_727097 [Obba rivulosa]